MRDEITTIELTSIHVPFKEAVKEAMKQSEGGLGLAIAAELK